MSAIRPLPAKPSLEFEKKEAKALLQRLRAGDPDVLERAHAHTRELNAANAKLTDAQFVIAREYGFASWPRLVQYFRDVERLSPSSGRASRTIDMYERQAQGMLRLQQTRDVLSATALAAYVPRLYGVRVDDVYAMTITEEEARLAVARWSGFPGWAALLQYTATSRASEPDPWHLRPGEYAAKAIEARDLTALQRIVAQHPELVHLSDYEIAEGSSLMGTALHHERTQGVEALRPIVEWLEQQGVSMQQELNRQLCGHMHMDAEKVRWLLERGADPDYIAPGGIPVLEYALIRYWNGAAVDVLAARAQRRKALWIAAGLGDIDGVSSFLDRNGKPTAAARRLRPDLVAVGPAGIPSLPDPDDEVILMEAFFIALLNNRTDVLEYMAKRGFPVDSVVWGSPVINIAVGNAWISQIESLIRCGANLDVKGYHPRRSAREVARDFFESLPHDANRRRVAELCGLDPDAILAERNARVLPPPRMVPKLKEALELGADDALRLGQSHVQPENLLFGLLRSGGLPVLFFTKLGKIDLDRFREDVQHRIHTIDDRAAGSPPPMSAEAQAMIDAAVAGATNRRREVVIQLDLLHVLLLDADGPAAKLLARYGSSAAELLPELERSL